MRRVLHAPDSASLHRDGACHFSNQGNDLASLAKVLDKFPNLYVDLSARSYEIGREPRTAARFLERYQDRVLFGTDRGIEKSMYRSWWRLLETPDEYMPGPNWWRLYRLELSSAALEKIYRGNALKLLNRTPVE
jgi:predicted TIM-barrel fold metal-dependent hydrolase